MVTVIAVRPIGRCFRDPKHGTSCHRAEHGLTLLVQAFGRRRQPRQQKNSQSGGDPAFPQSNPGAEHCDVPVLIEKISQRTELGGQYRFGSNGYFVTLI